MHYLDRTSIPAPASLNNYQHGRHTWNDLSRDDRQEICAALEAMQGQRCAYCECDLNKHDRHIEHFRQRGRYPQGTFDWNNLFWSCKREDSCGKHKDSCGIYQHPDLIKPDVDDPEQFFIFVADGSITVRDDLTNHDRNRAEETLRIFNLDAQWGPLRNIRRTAVIGYIKTAEAIQELAQSYPPEAWMSFLEEELEQIQELPFCTAIKHVLTPQGVRP